MHGAVGVVCDVDHVVAGVDIVGVVAVAVLRVWYCDGSVMVCCWW